MVLQRFDNGARWHFASLLWALKHWNALSVRNHFVEFTNVFLVSSRWRASPSIPASSARSIRPSCRSGLGGYLELPGTGLKRGLREAGDQVLGVSSANRKLTGCFRVRCQSAGQATNGASNFSQPDSRLKIAAGFIAGATFCRHQP